MNPLPEKLNQGKNRPDVLIVGAGIFGLWAARHAIRAGKKVLVVDRGRAGAGASGGFLGALMPHMPDRWNEKKQFQFEALTSLPEAVGELEADTGMACGYRRCGRLMPIRAESSLAEIGRRISGAREHWRGLCAMERIAPPLAGKVRDGWLSEAEAAYGAQFDDLSARIDPRAYLAALRAFVEAKGALREGVEIAQLEPARGRAVLAKGGTLDAGEIVIAAGWQSYDLLQPFMGGMASRPGRRIGRGVKGQAVLIEFPHDDDLPIVYGDGIYIVPQAGGRVAIGSTARDDWDHESPDVFDAGDTGFCRRALELVPALCDAPIIERWANVRPRNMLKGMGTAPFMGKVPGHDRLSARIGGYRIGLGVGHMEPETL